MFREFRHFPTAIIRFDLMILISLQTYNSQSQLHRCALWEFSSSDVPGVCFSGTVTTSTSTHAKQEQNVLLIGRHWGQRFASNFVHDDDVRFRSSIPANNRMVFNAKSSQKPQWIDWFRGAAWLVPAEFRVRAPGLSCQSVHSHYSLNSNHSVVLKIQGQLNEHGSENFVTTYGVVSRCRILYA